MEQYQELEGNLITLAKEGKFDVITHGCNCFCTMGAGIAPQMAKAFNCDSFLMEKNGKGDINKLGQIDFEYMDLEGGWRSLWESEYSKIIVVNSYSQYRYGSNHSDGVKTPIDYEALTLCLRKINYKFKGKHIGLPKIGAGLAGGDWNRIKKIIQKELKDCKVTVVIYKNK
jgi:O-acetyl-ADP-ribose deacetylase (regulator of RNase III)